MRLFGQDVQDSAGPAHDFDDLWFDDMADLFDDLTMQENLNATQDNFTLVR